MSKYWDLKKRMMLSRYFIAFNQAHGELKSMIGGFMYDNINKFDSIEQERLIDIMNRINELGKIYDNQIKNISKIMDTKEEQTEDKPTNTKPEMPPLSLSQIFPRL